MTMRNAFVQALAETAEHDDRIVLLSGDIGNRMFDDFKARFPERFFNCGIAEQAMMSMAAGLASCGMRPVCYTIAPFVTTRCLEQIKIDVCYHDQPVIIVGVGAGLSYASLGATHHSPDDIAQLRALPGMTVIAPADPVETRLAFAAAARHDGPVYLRLGKKGEPCVHEGEPNFVVGRGITVRDDGDDVCLLSTGVMLPTAIDAADQIEGRCRVVSMHTVKPLDAGLLADAFERYRCVVTVEEHGLAGGFGSAVAEWLIDHGDAAAASKLLRIGMDDAFMHEAGNTAHAREFFGLTTKHIARRVNAGLNDAEPLKVVA